METIRQLLLLKDVLHKVVETKKPVSYTDGMKLMKTHPQIKPLHFFLRNSKIIKEFEINNYKMYYLASQNSIKVIECKSMTECIETVCVKKDGHLC